MTDFPFITRTGKVIKTAAPTYKEALDKVLTLFPNKFLNIKHAKNMVLIEAKVAAQRESKSQKGKLIIVYTDKDGEYDFGSVLPKGCEGQFAFLNGKQEKFTPLGKMLIISDTDELGRTTTTIEKGLRIDYTKDKKQFQKPVATETANNMSKNNKKGKSAAAKKGGAPKEKKVIVATIIGEKKTLKVSAILVLQSKGIKVYRQSNPTPGGILINKRLKSYANKDKEIAVIVTKKAA